VTQTSEEIVLFAAIKYMIDSSQSEVIFFLIRVNDGQKTKYVKSFLPHQKYKLKKIAQYTEDIHKAGYFEFIFECEIIRRSIFSPTPIISHNLCVSLPSDHVRFLFTKIINKIK
jgi:hypothetical protein